MGPAGIVEAEGGTQAGLCGRNRVAGLEIHLLVVDGSPEPLDEDVVPPAALAVNADLDAVFLEQPVNSTLENWLSWSVLKIPGLP